MFVIKRIFDGAYLSKYRELNYDAWSTNRWEAISYPTLYEAVKVKNALVRDKSFELAIIDLKRAK